MPGLVEAEIIHDPGQGAAHVPFGEVSFGSNMDQVTRGGFIEAFSDAAASGR
jgi:hypothetical protein